MSFFQSFFQTNNIVDTFNEKIKTIDLFAKSSKLPKPNYKNSNLLSNFDDFNDFNTFDSDNISIINLTNSMYPKEYNNEIYNKLLNKIKIFDISTHRDLMYKTMFKIDKQGESKYKYKHNNYEVVCNLTINNELLSLLID
jgi:hypothetical protein